jgi:hypothetical protein
VASSSVETRPRYFLANFTDWILSCTIESYLVTGMLCSEKLVFDRQQITLQTFYTCKKTKDTSSCDFHRTLSAIINLLTNCMCYLESEHLSTTRFAVILLRVHSVSMATKKSRRLNSEGDSKQVVAAVNWRAFSVWFMIRIRA